MKSNSHWSVSIKYVFMKIVVLSLFSFFILTTVFGQTNTAEFPIGKWGVEIARTSERYHPPDSFIMSKVINVFEKTTLIFNENHQFILQAPVPDIAVQNAHWDYLPASGVIEIGEWSDREHRLPLLHKLIVTKDGHGRYVITFTDMGVELLLKKM